MNSVLFCAILSVFAFPRLALASEKSAPISIVQPEASKEFLEEEQNELGNIYRYRDIYIISGYPDTKIQLSLKLRIVKQWELYVGYSQLMFWELGTEKSNPFSDIAYNPELFYAHEIGNVFLHTLSLGIEHRSNGKATLFSRSFDRIFTQFDNHFGMGNAKFSFSLRAYAFYDLDKTNKDLQEYTGLWDARLTASSLSDWWFPSKTDVYISFFPGGHYSTKILKGGQEIGLKIRVRLLGLLPYLLLQSYHGHSESLLDYDEQVEAYRIGFLL